MEAWRRYCREYADENNLQYGVVEEVYLLLFRYIRDKIKEYDVLGEYDVESFKRSFKSFRLPGLGTLYPEYRHYRKNKYSQEKKNGSVQNKVDIGSVGLEGEPEEIGEGDFEI